MTLLAENPPARLKCSNAEKIWTEYRQKIA